MYEYVCVRACVCIWGYFYLKTYTKHGNYIKSLSVE